MATKYWLGAAAKVAQVTRVTWSAYTSGITYNLIINSKTISFTATTSIQADIIDGLVAAWSASGAGETLEIVASSASPNGILLTGQLGIPFTVTASASSGSATVASVTAATGPNFWNLAANWQGGSLPSAGDDLILEDSAVDILYGLTDTNNYDSLRVNASYTGRIGLPKTNANGYPEYRTRFLTLGDGADPIAVTIGQGIGRQSNLILLALVSATSTVKVYGTGAAPIDSSAVIVSGMGASSTIDVYGGNVEVQSSTIATAQVIGMGGGTKRPELWIRSGCTVTTVKSYGAGTTYLDSSATTGTARDSAELVVGEAAAVATVNVAKQGKATWLSTGGIGTKLNVEQGGTINFSGNGSAKTVAAAAIDAGGTIMDPIGVVTWTAGIELSGCRLKDVSMDLGANVTVSV